ncbi:MAG: hypothetical protein NT069_21375, partial [Planctomycetota bacterium]|nr:hypothetical protein [Planctomycetota bacterium]
MKILATAIAQAIELKPWPTADEFDFAVDVSTGLALAAVRSQWGHLPTETAVCVTRMIATSFGRSCPPGLAHATTKAAYEVVMNAIQPPDKPLTIGQTYRRIDAAIAAILCAGSAGQAANANQQIGRAH